MFKNISRVRIYYFSSLMPFTTYKEQSDNPDTWEKVKKPKVKAETGWQRVKDLFEYTPDGYMNKDLVSLMDLASGSFAIGTAFASAFYSVKSFDNYVDSNQQTKYVSPYEARRKLQDYVIIQGFKKGIGFGVKCTIFTGILGFVSIVISTYRGKEGILEYFIAAGIAGAFVRFYVGLKAAFAGFFVGGTLGALFGSFVWLGNKLTNVSMSDLRTTIYDIRIVRTKREKELQKQIYHDNDSKYLRYYIMNLKNKMLGTDDDEDMISETKDNVNKQLDEDDSEKQEASVIMSNNMQDENHIGTKVENERPVLEFRNTR